MVAVLLVCFGCAQAPVNGYGERVYDNGDRYVGQFYNGLRDGAGTYISHSGDRYDGNWSQGEPHGKLSYVSTDGTSYVGDWVNGKREGKGVGVYISGNKYVGEYKNDKFNGWGTLYLKDGGRQAGQWQNNMLNGLAAEYNASGVLIREGEWKNDVLVKTMRQLDQEAAEQKARQLADAEATRRQWAAWEAEARAAERRKAALCPWYALIRQTCAGAGNYQNCMVIRMSGKYDADTDRWCFNR